MSGTDKQISKFLSLILRHRPQVVGITLENDGWVAVDALLEALEKQKRGISLSDIQRVVAENDKQRFAFSEDGLRIRANQGHSVKVELNYPVAQPPEKLFHGTATKFLNTILRDGLRKMKRHHVHLSASVETASKVGVRHGELVLLQVESGKMSLDGHVFYCSANGVWLVDHVPPQYLSLQNV